jgi:hypothetical protein
MELVRDVTVAAVLVTTAINRRIIVEYGRDFL